MSLRIATMLGLVCGLGWSVAGPARAFDEPKPDAAAEKMSPDHRAFFENKIRPVLVKQCYSCHSADAEALGGKLRVDSRGGMRGGGESGPAVVEGNPEASLLIQALRYDGIEMPPEAPLPEQVVADFVKWVEMGAPDPRDDTAAALAAVEAEAGELLWSLQPVASPRLPAVSRADWCRDPIDRFVLARMDEAKLSPTGDAPSRVLARRLYFDLIGLPPTAEQLEAFEQACAEQGPGAVERLVDELLASPEFGVQWGRHWLDVARYGESNGNDGLSRNPTFPHAWRYRDYVIAAFNNDLPYNTFITEQVAGDLLAAETPEARDRQLVATGFLALGSKPAKAMNVDFEMDVAADQIDVVATAIMGLSVACARCHDHKHDPIPTSDYYALAGIFTSTETMWGLAANEGLTAPRTDLHELQTAPTLPPPSEEDAAAIARATGGKKPSGKPKYPPGAALAMGVRDREKPADCKINIKGESKRLGPSVPRGFLSACSFDHGLTIEAESSGRRELAQWLTDPRHPLTARVYVNRVWRHLLGGALVRTVDDFGVYGERPTHPELLDHLAARFVSQGWSTKRLIRSIVLSRTYQLDSQCDPAVVAADPENLWFARHDRRRLTAEELRDSILAVTGALDRQPGEGSAIQHLDILVNKAGSLHRPHHHRSVYLCMLRNSEPPELAPFDLPDSTRPTGVRNVTTLPTQALFLINNPFLVEQAARFAESLLSAPELDELDASAGVRWAFRRALHREPSTVEMAQAAELLAAAEKELSLIEPAADARRIQVWSSLCQALLASTEFRYID